MRRRVRFSDHVGNTVVVIRSRLLHNYDALISRRLYPAELPWHPLEPPDSDVRSGSIKPSNVYCI